MSEGKKFDEDKLRMDLIPPEAINALARILTNGAKKYGDRNWEEGMDWGRIFAAIQRHLWAWWEGEDKDDEWGLSHLDHALTDISFLITYEARNVGNDNREKNKWN